MRTYIFRSDQIVDAQDEQEAWAKFADNSFDFAANAECEEITSIYVPSSASAEVPKPEQ